MSAEKSPRSHQRFPDDLESLPVDSFIDGAKVSRDIEDSADYVVVGSGAGGSSAAFALASAGFSVIMIEEGPWVRTRDFGVDVYPAMKKMFRSQGTQVALGRSPFPLMQGRCVGGGTTVNSAIAWRAPEQVIDSWGAEFGLSDVINNRALEEHYAFIEKTLNVHSVTDPALGLQSKLLGEAAKSVGIHAERIRRYDGGCEASASCLTGCRSGKKLGMNISYIPQTLHRGGRIYTEARVEKVESHFGRATAVRARFAAPGEPGLRVRARRGVLIAASAVQTPNVLRRSGLRASALGKHFQTHPGTTLTARFEGDVGMDIGATQGYHSTHFVNSDRYKIESLSLPPEILCARIAQVGPQLMETISDYKRLLNWAIILRGEAEGSVNSHFGADYVKYTPTGQDMLRIRKALKKVSELMFTVGAKEVFPSVHGVPRLRSPDDLRFWDEASLDPRAYGMMSSHLFGGARMGRDPRNSVTGVDFQVHGMRGIYVVDSSVFPTNTGINPQHSIMAVARLAASRILERPLPPR